MPEPGLLRSALRADVRAETWLLGAPFVISRERFETAELVVVTLDDGTHRGRGECCPVARYGETTQSVLAAVEYMLAPLRDGAEWDVLHDQFPAGAARNAVDCAMWDLRAKRSGRPAYQLLGLEPPGRVESVLTISVDTPERMAEAARSAAGYRILKLKLGENAPACVAAVRAAAPGKRLIADANEGWDACDLATSLPALADARIELLEQPLPAGGDEALRDVRAPLPIAADESCHVATDVASLADRYTVVNIKLDKTGGLTEAVRLQRAARAAGLETMVGCMLGTSLAMAPAMLLTRSARFVDLDAPLLIGRDREPALTYDGGWIDPPRPELWG